MPVYKFSLSKKKADDLHARLKTHYHSQASLPHLMKMAVYDYLCVLGNIDTPANPGKRSGFFRWFRK